MADFKAKRSFFAKKLFSNSCLALLIVAGGPACVSATKYQALQDENGAGRRRLALCEAQVSELEDKLGIASDEKTRLTSSVDEMKQAMEELQRRKAETERRLAEFRDLTARFQKLVDAGKLKIRFQNGKMVLALPTDILFPSGSAGLSPAGENAIKEVTQVLSSLKEKKFQVEGHTDNVPILVKKQFESNWELASARAISVLDTMLKSGMPSSRISAASFGDTQPVANNQTSEGKAANRRIAIVVVPDLTGLPGYDELNRLTAATAK